MRISSGRLRNRQIQTPNGRRTHPMSERARLALFNVLGDLEGLRLLDAYGGSGAIAFEALSRGAKFAHIVEQDHHAFEVIESNVEALGLTENEVHVTKANVDSWAKQARDERFDVIICDPPYDHVVEDHLETLAGLLEDDGLFVLSHPGDPIEIPGLKQLDTRKYAGAHLSFYRK